MSHVADFSLQADETPCTILYTIGDQKVDVGKATIMEPKEPLFHSRPIPPNVFKVSVASVKPGHENLPPLILVGDDDETPRRLGDCCNGWVLLWPKSLLRLEAAGSTPTSTQPQQGMNINTPPTQLASGVGLGDSGRGKEEAPLVADDVAMDEDEDDDGAEQYVYTGASSGFERHESVPELPSQRIMDDLPVVKKSRKRARKGKKADSMIQPPQQPRLQDRIDIPDADKWHIPGQPILPATALRARFGDLKRLHDDVLRVEKGLIASKDPGYPLYVVNVPRQMSYVDSFPADKFFLRFDYIFDMFHVKKLDFTFVRLYALHMNYIIGVEQISHICVADPYYMHEGFLGVCAKHREYARDYIVSFMLANKDKEAILVPYHPM